MDSSMCNKHSRRAKLEDAIDVGATPQPLRSSGDAEEIDPWESFVAEIIHDVVHDSSIDVMRFDTFQEGE